MNDKHEHEEPTASASQDGDASEEEERSEQEQTESWNDEAHDAPAAEAPSHTAADQKTARGESQWKHALVNSFIALFLFLVLADGLPMRTTFTKRLKAGLDPFLDASGIWQDNWKLFAPNVDKINTYLDARVYYSDGSKWTWTSTDWQSIGRLRMFFYVRLVKLWDLMRRDDHRAAWPALVNWVLTEAPDRGDAKPVRVELYRHWWDAPHPKKAEEEWSKHSEIPPPRDEFPEEYRFYRKSVR